MTLDEIEILLPEIIKKKKEQRLVNMIDYRVAQHADRKGFEQATDRLRPQEDEGLDDVQRLARRLGKKKG